MKNKWLEHVAQVRKKSKDLTQAEILKKAKKTYKK